MYILTEKRRWTQNKNVLTFFLSTTTKNLKTKDVKEIMMAHLNAKQKSKKPQHYIFHNNFNTVQKISIV